jgi:hypothetical protein
VHHFVLHRIRETWRYMQALVVAVISDHIDLG